MIRAVTLNTGFDETLRVGDVDDGGVAPILTRSIEPSGKGINCARTLRALKSPVVAYGLIGEHEETAFRTMLRDEQIESRLVALPQRTRTNVNIRPPTGANTHYRAAGFELERSNAVERLRDLLVRDIAPGDIVSLHGSTPNGAAVTAWYTMAHAAAAAGAIVFVDVYGPALVHVLDAHIALVCKPNEEEALVIPGVAGDTEATAVAAVRRMAALGVWFPMVTCGAKGAVFGNGQNVWRVSLDAERVVAPVGAGDACMGGLMASYANGERDPRALARVGIASAVAHVEGVPLHEHHARVDRLVGLAGIARV